MTVLEYLKTIPMKEVSSPAYFFDMDVFEEKIEFTKSVLKDIPLTFSIKANPFLLSALPEGIRHVEVCSPGELTICKKYAVDPKRIIYSGVNKEVKDVHEAIEYGVDYVTAESLKHVRVEEEVCARLQTTARVLLRLTSGNQFGMSQEDIFSIFENIQQYPHLHIAGIHYYSGTQKKERQLAKDIERLDAFMTLLKEKYHFEAELLEMGPGIGAEYFEAPYEEKERENLFMAVPYLAKLKEKYPLGIEMGRFLSSGCGTFSTRVKDIKNNSDTEYVIVDGGMHQLKYYGQTMAMKVPEIHVLQAVPQDTKKTYCVCGSLCTVADVLVREVELPVLREEDILLFERCGAYSVTEGSALFLSRELPAVYVYSEKKGMQKVRDILHTSALNSL